MNEAELEDTAEFLPPLSPERQREIVEAWQRSDFDIAPCRMCNKPVVCIPDGLPFCADCGNEDTAQEDAANG